MPKTLKPLCSASRSHFRAAPKHAHVWVSDDLLSETFNKFVRNHARNGSNVPGPLEARRRSAKRKMTSLGHSAVTNNSIDPAVLFGSQPQPGWWKAPVTADRSDHQPVFDWPFPAPRLSPTLNHPVLMPSIIAGTRKESVALDTDRPRTPEQLLSERLKQIRNQEALMRVLDEVNVDLIQKPHLARRILWQMTRNKWDFTEVAAFLLEPRTNPAGSGNHAYLFKHWQTHATLLTWLFEQKIFFKAAQLGLLGVDDLKKIILLAHEVDPSIFPGTSDRTAFCNGLLEAIRNSKILELNDLGEPFIFEWLQLLRKREFQASLPQLLWRLCGTSISDDSLLLRRVLSISISMIDRSSVHLVSYLVDFMMTKPHNVVNQTIFIYTWMLMQRSPSNLPLLTWVETMRKAKANTSFRKALLARASTLFDQASSCIQSHTVDTSTRSLSPKPAGIELDREPSKIEIWYVVLVGLGTAKSNQFTLCKSTFEKWVDHGKANSDERGRLLVGLWVVMALSVRDDSALVRFKDQDLGQLIYERFSAECEKRGEDILASILTVLRKSRFPARNQLLQWLGTFSDGFINVRSSHETLQAQLTSLKEGDIPRLSEKLFYISVRHHFPHLLTSLAESVNKDLANFEQVCGDIIRNVKGSINLVLRLLFHNRQLQFALSRAASGMAEDASLSLQENRAAPTDEAFGGYTYAQLVEMIDNIAMECAGTTNLTDRNAFRKVHWLHMYLQMHGAPLTPRIRRALWHAAAVRPAKPTYSMVKYVHDLVVEYEGSEAVEKLLQASATQLHEQEFHEKMIDQQRKQVERQEDDSVQNARYKMDSLELMEADLKDEMADDDQPDNDQAETSAIAIVDQTSSNQASQDLASDRSRPVEKPEAPEAYSPFVDDTP